MKKFLSILLVLILVLGVAFAGYVLGSGVDTGSGEPEAAVRLPENAPEWMSKPKEGISYALRSAKGSYPVFDNEYFGEGYWDSYCMAHAEAEAVSALVSIVYAEMAVNDDDGALLEKVQDAVNRLAFKQDECTLDGEYWAYMSVNFEDVKAGIHGIDDDKYHGELSEKLNEFFIKK